MMLSDVAWARNYGMGSFVLPTGDTDREDKRAEAATRNMPGLPVEVVKMFHGAPPAGDVCGRCTAFNAITRQCTERGFMVLPADPACPVYVPIEEPA
jgi:hypothetical protein